MISAQDLLIIAHKLNKTQNVLVDGKKFVMHPENNGFTLDLDELFSERKHLTREYELLKIDIEGSTYFAHEALNIKYPQSKYIFFRISSTESLSLYDTALFSFSIEGENYFKNQSFTIENNISINTTCFEIGGERYIEIKASEKINVDRIIGITLRYRHALAFLYNNIQSKSFVIVSNNNDEFLITHGAKVSVKHQYSVFSKPHEWNYINVSRDMYPKVEDYFLINLIRFIIMDTSLYNVTLLISEKSLYGIYASTSVSFVALEMLSTHFSKSEDMPERVKIESKNIKSIYERHIARKLKSKIICSDTYNHISRKLNSFLQPANADKLKSLLERYGLQISKHDNHILKLRNKYLHGTISEDSKKEMNDYRTYLSACRIASTIILKICGYSGPICYYDKLIANPAGRPSIEEAFSII